MKRHIHILFLAFVMAACTPAVETRHGTSLPNNMVHHHLQAIDSLMWQQPDSALAVMLDFAASPQADSLDVFDGHYCQLLISELLYKNDCEQTNRKDLLQAVDYFDSLCMTGDVAHNDSTRASRRHCGLDPQSPDLNDDIAFLTARAHYINGVGFYEQGEVVNACEEYLKAFEVMEERFEEEELLGHKAKIMTFSYGRLAELFSDQYMMENSIVCYENALSYCQRTPTSPRGVSRILFNIGHQYEMLNELKKALKYYVQATEHMPDTNHVLYRDIRAHIVICNYELGTDSNQSIEILRHNISQSEKESERNNYSLFIGSIYAEEKMHDSALVYLEPLFEHYGEIEAAKYLRVIYDSLGYAEKAEACVRFLADNIQSEGENKALVSQLNQVFKQYLDKKQAQQVAQEKRNAVVKAMNWAAPIAVFLFTCFYFVMKRRHRMRMMAARLDHETLQNVSVQLKQANQEVSELKYQISQQNDLIEKTKSPNANSFRDEPVYHLIMERVEEGKFKAQVKCSIYANYALSKEQMNELRYATDFHFNQFTARLKQAYPKLTNGDLDYCCLYLLGLTDADVSALMQRAYNTVNERNSKLKQIFGTEESLPVLLRSFVSQNATV